MARRVRPTSPITRALIGPSAAILAVLEGIAKIEAAHARRGADPVARARAIQEYLQRQKNHILSVQSEAENLAGIIEQRLRAVESAANDVVNQSGGVVPLSDETPADVGAAGAAGSGDASSRDDHVHAGVTSIGKTSQVQGVMTFAGSGVTQVGKTFTFTGGGGQRCYHLPIQIPYVSIRGTTFLPITLPTPVSEVTSSEALAFEWSAGNDGVDAEWQLVDSDTGDVILSGSRAAPFAPTTEEVTAAGSNLPSGLEFVELQVRFSGAGAGGDGAAIQFARAATWEVT